MRAAHGKAEQANLLTFFKRKSIETADDEQINHQVLPHHRKEQRPQVQEGRAVEKNDRASPITKGEEISAEVDTPDSPAIAPRKRQLSRLASVVISDEEDAQTSGTHTPNSPSSQTRAQPLKRVRDSASLNDHDTKTSLPRAKKRKQQVEIGEDEPDFDNDDDTSDFSFRAASATMQQSPVAVSSLKYNEAMEGSNDAANELLKEMKGQIASFTDNDTTGTGVLQNETKSSDDMYRWLMALPIANTSSYFVEYAAVICGNFGGSLSDLKSKGFPSWLKPETLRDASGNRPDSPMYDVGTLSVPENLSKSHKEESKHTTPAMIQYWDVKKEHFDKIILFKIGKFYEVFYVDAFIAQRVCNLRWMGNDEKPHVGFPEPSLHQNAALLVDAGFKVVVVEQMETPHELEERNKQATTKQKAIKRDICEIYSAGTVLHDAMLPPDGRILLSLVINKDAELGFSFVDVSTSRLWVGTITNMSKDTSGAVSEVGSNMGPGSPVSNIPDTEAATEIQIPVVTSSADTTRKYNQLIPKLKSLLYQIIPVEVILDQHNTAPEIMRLFRILPSPPHINNLSLSKFEDTEAFALLEARIGAGFCDESDGFSKIREHNKAIMDTVVKQSSTTRLSLLSLSRYLAAMLLEEKILHFARLEAYTAIEGQQSQKMVIDATCLRHLSLLQTPHGEIEGSLFGFLCRTVTPAGRQLLRRWIVAPLTDVSAIEARLQVVDWFLNNLNPLKKFREAVSRVPFIQRLLAKICTRGLQGARSAVYFGDVHAKHFADFIRLLDALVHVIKELGRLHQSASSEWDEVHRADGSRDNDAAEATSFEHCNNAEVRDQTSYLSPSSNKCPRRIDELCRNNDAWTSLIEGVNDIKSTLEKRSDGTWTIKEGADEEYDNVLNDIRRVKEELHEHLDDLKKRFQTSDSSAESIRFVHSKYPFEIEVPETHSFWKSVRNSGPDVDVTSTRAGFIRFRNDYIVGKVAELEQEQQRAKDCMYGCQQRIYQRFYKRHYDTAIQLDAALAEIDVLAAFAMVSSNAAPAIAGATPITERYSRPQFIPGQSQPFLRLKDSRHPLVAEALLRQGETYVPNDLCLGDETSEDSESFLLITGPNMGGKSTLLRQVCIAIIMAQMGCYVAASECALTPVDRIFTRLGAYDSILEGKSTFLVELDEAANAVKHATARSLVVMDELGRGTATFDGSAIAVAIAHYLATTTKRHICWHILQCRTLFTTHFQVVIEELNSFPGLIRPAYMAAHVEDQRLRFFYKLIRGISPESHGILVAVLAGLRQEIVAEAAIKAKEFREEMLHTHLCALTNPLLEELAVGHSHDSKRIDWEQFDRNLERLLSSRTATIIDQLRPTKSTNADLNQREERVSESTKESETLNH